MRSHAVLCFNSRGKGGTLNSLAVHGRITLLDTRLRFAKCVCCDSVLAYVSPRGLDCLLQIYTA